MTSANFRVAEIAQRVRADGFLQTPYALRDLDSELNRLLSLNPPL